MSAGLLYHMLRWKLFSLKLPYKPYYMELLVLS